MNKERRQKLLNDYPDLFSSDKDVSEEYQQNPIVRWGFEHGDGWLSLVEDLCFALQQRVVNLKVTKPQYSGIRILQVKEKFGYLRVYTNANNDDYVNGLIRMAELVSGRTCEECGNPGSIRKTGWMRVRCDACEANRFKKQEQNECTESEN